MPGENWLVEKQTMKRRGICISVVSTTNALVAVSIKVFGISHSAWLCELASLFRFPHPVGGVQERK